MDHHAREERGRRARLHRRGRERPDVLRVVRFASQPRRRDRRGRRRHEDLLGARLQPGRVLPDRRCTPTRSRSPPKATLRRPSGERTPLTRDDVREILERAHRRPDGSFRTAAGRLLPGKVIGGFKYQGTRPDDPNDIVPHEHRRELRALRVFGAWTNLTDMKAGNTLDTVITRGRPRRGPALPAGCRLDVRCGRQRPARLERGLGAPLRRRAPRSGGSSPSGWPSVRGRRPITRTIRPSAASKATSFDPETWKPRAPTAAYREMRDDDAFWAARRVMAFSDALIRAIVKTGEFSDPAAEKHLADVLIKRRDKIGRAYLTRINPIVDPALDASGVLTFGNAAVQYGLATAPRGYTAAWHAFDNATGASKPLGQTTGGAGRIQAAVGLARDGRRVHPRRPECRSSGTSDLEGTRPGVLRASSGRLEARRPGASARRASRRPDRRSHVEDEDAHQTGADVRETFPRDRRRQLPSERHRSGRHASLRSEGQATRPADAVARHGRADGVAGQALRARPVGRAPDLPGHGRRGKGRGDQARHVGREPPGVPGVLVQVPVQ